MDPLTASLLMSAGGGALDALTGDDERMSPEQRKVFNLLMGRLGESQNVQGRIDALTQRTKRFGTEQAASLEASSARRGVPMSAGQTTQAQVGITGKLGEGLMEAIPDIQHQAKNEELGILNSLAGMTPPPEKNDFSGDFGDMAGNAMFYWLMKDRKKKSNIPDDSIYGWPSPGDRG